MRQVPKYLIIGDGRVAHHFQHYLSLLNIPFYTWCRKQSYESLQQLLLKVSHVLLLISDNAIEEMALYCRNILPQAIYIHCSGSLLTPYAFGAHPLTTFNSSLYKLSEYQEIPFILDDNAPEFKILLPGLNNSHDFINPALKPKYHALCVLSGNFTCMLWQKFFTELKNIFNMSPAISHPYLLRLTQNLMQDPGQALTGPLVRNDQVTIKRNLEALRDDPFHSIYENFVACYQSLQREKI